MGKRLEGKVAVVTGGGSKRGIGRSICLALASEGASVVVNDLSVDSEGNRAADAVVAEIVKAGGKAVANYDSVATMAGGESIIKTAVDNFGKIDILVNTAGNYLHVHPLETTEEQWDQIMNVHLKGHFACSKAAALEMVKNKTGGRIINFSSRGTFYGRGGEAFAYGTAKAGILGFTNQLARALKKENITVNCILPSATTELFPGDKVGLGDYMPTPSTTDPDFVAPIVTYLCTDEAQDITGQFVYAAGGDICFYDKPFLMASGHRFIRTNGKWTLEELDEIIPSIT